MNFDVNCFTSIFRSAVCKLKKKKMVMTFYVVLLLLTKAGKAFLIYNTDYNPPHLKNFVCLIDILC